ncbi:MAG: DUF4412 domain-containing protein [Acidobacteriota bacterium]
MSRGGAWAAGLPSAESLLDRYVEVTGGKAAYENRKSEVAHGTMEFVAQGLKGKMVRYADASGLYRMTMDLPGIGTMETGVRDGVAWERSDLMGPRTKTGAERAESLREAVLNSISLWRQLFPKVETIGEETVNGEECYKVAMYPGEGNLETLFLSKKSGLAVKLTTVTSTQMGDLAAEILFSGYKNFGGILTPVKVIERAAGQEISITLDSVEVNAPIPADQLEFPADVAALLGKQKVN